MTYGANTLFIGSGSSSTVYSIPSLLTDVPLDLSLVVSRQELSTVCSTASIAVRDMATASLTAQLLPSERTPSLTV